MLLARSRAKMQESFCLFWSKRKMNEVSVSYTLLFFKEKDSDSYCQNTRFVLFFFVLVLVFSVFNWELSRLAATECRLYATKWMLSLFLISVIVCVFSSIGNRVIESETHPLMGMQEATSSVWWEKTRSPVNHQQSSSTTDFCFNESETWTCVLEEDRMISFVMSTWLTVDTKIFLQTLISLLKNFWKQRETQSTKLTIH